MTGNTTATTEMAMYTLAEAAERLCTSVQLVQMELVQGTLRAYTQETPDGLSLVAADIDRIAIDREHAILIHSTDPLLCAHAAETDIQELTWLHEELYGEKEPWGSYQHRLERYRQDPEMYLLIKQSNILLGFIGQIAIRQEAIAAIMTIENEATEVTYARLDNTLLTKHTISPITSGQPAHIYISLGVKQGLPQSAEAGYALMHAYIDLLKSYVAQGIIVESLYAVSETVTGIRCCLAFHFTETYLPGVPLHRFHLNLLASHDLWAQSYQQVVFARYPELRKQVHASANNG